MAINDCSWLESWDSFARHVIEYAKEAKDFGELNQLIVGRRVVWTGTLEAIGLDDIAPNVCIEFPPQALVLNDGRTAMLDGFSLSVGDGSKDLWSNIAIGETVTFEAQVGSGESIFPPLEVGQFGSEKTFITVRLSEGVPVRETKNT